jgi:hypothetical protein
MEIGLTKLSGNCNPETPGLLRSVDEFLKWREPSYRTGKTGILKLKEQICFQTELSRALPGAGNYPEWNGLGRGLTIK